MLKVTLLKYNKWEFTTHFGLQSTLRAQILSSTAPPHTGLSPSVARLSRAAMNRSSDAASAVCQFCRDFITTIYLLIYSNRKVTPYTICAFTEV